MKIAITSTGNTLDSYIDQRFGRCAFFIIYDTAHKSVEFVSNPNTEAESGAGPASVQFIAKYNVSKIISGEFGVKIKPILDSLKIQMIVIKDEKKIKDIINMLNN